MGDSMERLKVELKELACFMGAVRARVADLKGLAGPPSADPTYVLPDARSVISFAVPLGTDFIEDYLGKKTRTVFKEVMYRNYLLVGAIGEALASRLKREGFRSEAISPNGVYRSRKEVEGSNAGFLVPDFSHRFAAVASGLGTFGWSGNVLVEGHWSAVFLGSTITEAQLPPDEPIDEALCDGCRICTKVCPLEFIQKDESQTVRLGGRSYTYSARSHHMRCALACGGFNGRSRNRKWSSWATLDYEFPERDDQLLEQFARAMKDPQARYILPQLGLKPGGGLSPWALAARNRRKGILFRSLDATNPTCCHCLLVCSGPREWRTKLMKTLHSAGVVVRSPDGTERAVSTA